MRTLQGIISWLAALAMLMSVTGCGPANEGAPTIGFADAFEDSTIGQAKEGFLAALRDGGFSEADKTLNVLYRNAQGDIPTLTQIIRYFISQKVSLIAACPSLSTITALQNTSDIPVFMMVSPTPELMNVTDAQGRAPGNLYGVGENLAYIDTSFALIPRLVKPEGGALRVGLLFNQSEPQSVDAYERLQALAASMGITLVSRPVNSTADVKLVAGALLHEDIDAFFANPDNTVFSSFETIIKACNEAGVPVFTSEAGLVARGAVAAYGADIYQWGYQAGEQAARFLKGEPLENLHWEMVQQRKRSFNPTAAARFGIEMPAGYEPIQ
ncbi:MAG: ABC transporter substrate-binding protein [Phaeodactylibacter sp.]|nr:ABC transporter substrate-binding protein [Phaeodactylibacter sp.]MCB9275239.1 ABC transporter substrate-binding protein [Lewinellaceae bacterium]